MGTSKEEIRQWLLEGKKSNATHVLIVVDTYDHEDYPVFVKVGQDVKLVVDSNNGNMQRVMEVYALHLDIDKQLNEYRSFHLENP